MIDLQSQFRSGMGGFLRSLFLRIGIRKLKFDNSAQYWDDRYASGGSSGDGSYGQLAKFKADTINHFITQNNVESVIEFGCGDGNQLAMFNIPKYIGLDVSKTVIEQCKNKFREDSSKTFFHLVPDSVVQVADLSLSLDVIYHLIEDDVYHKYMQQLFTNANKWVIIYSSNSEEPFGDDPAHCRNRKFTEWVSHNMQNWMLKKKVDNPMKERSVADFYFFEKKSKEE